MEVSSEDIERAIIDGEDVLIHELLTRHIENLIIGGLKETNENALEDKLIDELDDDIVKTEPEAGG